MQTGSSFFFEKRFEIDLFCLMKSNRKSLSRIDFSADRYISTFLQNASLTVILYSRGTVSPRCHASRQTCSTVLYLCKLEVVCFPVKLFDLDLLCLLKSNSKSYITHRFP